jgi:PAS domain S-box-containing protein
MTIPLKILYVEDDPHDAELVLHELKKKGYEPIVTRVQTKEEFLEHLLPSLDIILADYALPHFTGLEALVLLKERYPDIPLIIITGVLGDKKAAEAMKLGAADYLLKDRLARLGESVKHAIKERDLKLRDKEQECELRESEERFRLLYENSMDAILLTIPDGSILAANHAACKMFGRTEEEIIQGGRNSIIDVSDPPLVPALVEMMRDGRFAGELTFLRKDGMKFAGEISTSLFTDRHGKTRTSMIIRDISGRKLAENQREALIRELEQKNAELARFTYTVSHELRTPLITIQGFAGLIEEDVSRREDSFELTGHVQRISKAVDTLEELLSDLLKLSRAGRCIDERNPISFGSIAREAVDLFSHSLTEHTIRVEIAPDQPDVNVDPVRIREVLTNLIENAVKFRGNQPAPVIRIGFDRKDMDPVFFVQDNGIGIESRYLERIFNIFEKLDGSTQGAGVGLAIVKRIIEVHGGRIWAESEGIGKGTTFFFTLPLVL